LAELPDSQSRLPCLSAAHRRGCEFLRPAFAWRHFRLGANLAASTATFHHSALTQLAGVSLEINGTAVPTSSPHADQRAAPFDTPDPSRCRRLLRRTNPAVSFYCRTARRPFCCVVPTGRDHRLRHRTRRRLFAVPTAPAPSTCAVQSSPL
jgi:hypothetical protein